MPTALAKEPSLARFVDVRSELASPKGWMPLLVPKAQIDAEIGRLLDLGAASGERRAAEVVHPQAEGLSRGITPGMSVSINVVRPGESTLIHRDNANRIEFCIAGGGEALIGERGFTFDRWFTWTVPSMTRRQYRNSGSEPLVWLSYSNEPLLDRLGVLYADREETAPKKVSEQTVSGSNGYVRANAPDIPILTDGARLRGYEFLTDVEPVENKALLWPWQEVLPHMSTEEGDGKRTIMLMYNPATERRNGTTHSFFATISSFPPGKHRPPPPKGHRHSSYATNYHFVGGGSSMVDGQLYEWRAGDLMLSAPSWLEHSHGFAPEGAMVLTVQDHPFQIGIESLIWQERMDGPILTLGSEPGQTGYVGPRFVGE